MQNIFAPMTLKDYADRIKIPAFIALAKNDLFFEGQPEHVAAAVGELEGSERT